MMEKAMTQEQRLSFLVEAFKADSGEYKSLVTPKDTSDKRRVLRSLMNIRMPGEMPDKVLMVQDDYLRERAKEKGIVTLDDIPVFRDGLSIWQGDITRLSVDAIVNAANSQMLGCFVPMHTCIDNCIHSFAGIQLRAACSRQMEEMRQQYGPDYEQPTAVPMLTDAYNLPAKKVIHIVGPIVEDTLTPALEQALADCYTNTLDMCLKNGLKSVAFCCISTGVFRFPGRRAAEIAVKTVQSWMSGHPGAMDRVIFNVFKDEDKEYYEHLSGYSCITLRDNVSLMDAAAQWFHEKWGVPKEAYLDCMSLYLNGKTEYGWYLCLDGERIIGGLGIIENDFHDRKDLSPNVCAVYTEEAFRGQGIAGRLLGMAVEDMKAKGISPLYLVTDHIGFYERYGWEFYCLAHEEGTEETTRVYIHT